MLNLLKFIKNKISNYYNSQNHLNNKYSKPNNKKKRGKFWIELDEDYYKNPKTGKEYIFKFNGKNKYISVVRGVEYTNPLGIDWIKVDRQELVGKGFNNNVFNEKGERELKVKSLKQSFLLMYHLKY